MTDGDGYVTLGAAEDAPKLGSKDAYAYYEKKHRDIVDGFFGRLVERSGVDIEKNRATVKRHKEETERRDLVAKILKGKKALRVFLVVLIALGVVLFGLGIYFIAAAVSKGASVALAAIFPSAGAAALVSGAVILSVKTNPRIRELAGELSHREKICKKLESEAWEEMRPLNELFSDDTEIELLKRTFPGIITFEPNLSVSTYAHLSDCGFAVPCGENSCVTDTLSGICLGNPFVFTEVLSFRPGAKEYFGFKTINWEEHHRDSNGNDVTDYESETLRASVVKPFPEYKTETTLHFGRKDSTDLSFERHPGVSCGKKKTRGRKKKDAPSETENVPPSFEELFHARNVTSVEGFQKLFTDDAKENMSRLLTSEEGFGDDFSFIKKGKCVAVRAEHMQGWKMHTEGRGLMSMDYDRAASVFAAKNADYFRRFYFGFAPIFAIPAYTEGCPEYDETDVRAPGNFTEIEHEVMAEKFLEGEGRGFLAPVPLGTRCVVKTKLLEKRADGDLVRVTASGHYGEGRCDYVAMRGGDGNCHDVPVDWTEYFPISREADIFIAEECSPAAGRPCAVYHGLRVSAATCTD
ncbi:MAG: DUF2157 domain-containing protein [Clostridia bacterium]|nr:DUF2157 domain-containing protein [Clostridia bacterium]